MAIELRPYFAVQHPTKLWLEKQKRKYRRRFGGPVQQDALA